MENGFVYPSRVVRLLAAIKPLGGLKRGQNWRMILNTYCSIATSVFSWKLWKRPWCQLEFPSQDETVRVSVWLKKKLPTLTFSDRLLSYDLSLHCTDFFLERRNISYYLHCLEDVDLQMEVKMRSEVVSL